MAKYIIVKENDNSAGCLTGIIFLIIAVVALAIVAFYVLFIIGIILLIIAGIFAAIITIRNYILAVVESVKTHRSISKPSGWIFPTFIYRWIKLNWETIKGAWKYNINDIKNFAGKIGFYRILSFRKWFYLFATVSVTVLGTLISFFVIYIQIHFTICVFGIFFTVFSTVSLIFLLIGLIISLRIATVNYISSIRDSYRFCSATFYDYIVMYSVKEFPKIVANYWAENISKIKNNFSEFVTLPFMSFKKWVDFESAILLCVVGVLLNIIYIPIHLLIILILFVCFSVVNLVKKFIRH